MEACHHPINMRLQAPTIEPIINLQSMDNVLTCESYDMITSPDPHIIYEVQNGVLIIQIHRPEKKNALTQTMYKALADGIHAGEKNSQVKVILIRGSEDCFTSGNDVNDFVSGQDSQAERPSLQFMKAI